MSQDKYHVEDQSSMHKYRTEIPNIIKSLKLSGNELLLYFHYKSTAGDNGSCWKCLKTLEEETGLSRKTIKELNKKLIVPRDILGGLSLINLEHRFKEDGSPDSSKITIVDIWPINMTYCTAKKGGGVKITRGVGQNLPEGGVKFTPKEEHLNNIAAEGQGQVNEKEFEKAKDEEYLQKLYCDNCFTWLTHDDKTKLVADFGRVIVEKVLRTLGNKRREIREGNRPINWDSPMAIIYSECKKLKENIHEKLR